MRTGIVGLGLRAGNVLKMIMEDMPEMELVGYVDPDPCGLSIIEEHSNSLIQYQALDQMINESSLDLFMGGLSKSPSSRTHSFRT